MESSVNYKIGDKVVIIETDRTSLHEKWLNKVVTISGFYGKCPVRGIFDAYEKAVTFNNGDNYVLVSSIRPATKLEQIL